MAFTMLFSIIRITSANGFFLSFDWSSIFNLYAQLIVFGFFMVLFRFYIWDLILTMYRFTLNVGPVSSIVISNQLNDVNIVKVIRL